jgi:hypothetical protein
MGWFMTDFAHVVLTRFNVRWEATTKGLSNEWLTERIRLFEMYCYPSLYQQTNQNFKWLVLLDSRSPDWFKEKMSDYAKWQNFVPIYLEVPMLPEELGCPAELKSAIRAQIPQSYTHLITTRIDNDDAISKDYIQRVQDCFSGQDSQGIAFPIGYQFHDDCLYLEYSKGNHFISLIESYRSDDIKTVFVKHHSLLYHVAPVRQIWGRPSWLEVIHGANLSNRAKHGLVVSPADFQRRFASDLIPLRSFDTKSLRLRQAQFLSIGAPQYFVKKAINRLKHHWFDRPRRFLEER